MTCAFTSWGLATGATHFVSVTAGDSAGNQSACSPVASAVARISFSVTPSGAVNFGSVNVGTFTDRVFTITNTAGGSVSGTISVPAPFSIVSGGSFTLNGQD